MVWRLPIRGMRRGLRLHAATRSVADRGAGKCAIGQRAMDRRADLRADEVPIGSPLLACAAIELSSLTITPSTSQEVAKNVRVDRCNRL